MHSFASAIHVVAHTSSHGSAMSRGPCAGLIRVISGFASFEGGLRVSYVGYPSGSCCRAAPNGSGTTGGVSIAHPIAP